MLGAQPSIDGGAMAYDDYPHYKVFGEMGNKV